LARLNCYLARPSPAYTACGGFYRTGKIAACQRGGWAGNHSKTMVGSGSSGGGGGEGFTGRAAIGYDHGYDGEVFYLGLALDPHYVDGWVEGCLGRIGEDYPEEEQLFRELWEDETQRDVVIESLKADCEVRTGRPPG
jgi:hypothetical protein